MKRLTILLVEDSISLGEAFLKALRGAQRLRVGMCSSRRFLEKLSGLCHDAVLVDMITWSLGPQVLGDAVKRASGLVPVILLGGNDLTDSQLQIIREGAAGFVKHTASPRVLLNAIKAAASGQVWIDQQLFQRMLSREVSTVGYSALERQIMTYVASGKTNKEIGANLGCTERTVKARMSNLFLKAGVPNRSGLVSYAISRRFVEIPPRT